MSTQIVFPALHYRDADAAIAWLAEAFDATEHAVHRDGSGVVRHAELRVAGALVMLGAADAPPAPARGTGRSVAGGVSLYVVVGDPDARFARAARAGAEVLRELTDTEYGSREFTVADPEGIRWTFGTYDPLAATAEA